MPTPSSNPPPELPPRSHSSACPDEWRASATPSSSWPTQTPAGVSDNGDESDEQENIVIHGASGGEDAMMSPASNSSTPPHHQSTTDDDIDSRSNTESPRPDSRSGLGSAETTPGPEHHVDSGAFLSSSSTKTADDETEVDDNGTPRRDRRSRDQVRDAQTSHSATTSFEGMAPSTVADCDKMEAGSSSSAMPSRIQHEYCNPPMGYDFSNARITPTSYSSFLRPGSKFHGTQQSERQIYDVQVEIKYVDLKESFLCGYLKIQGQFESSTTVKTDPPFVGGSFEAQGKLSEPPPSGDRLTEDNPTLTTYFEGEIIGSKYHFITNHDSWGATEKIDLNHWNKFTAFRSYSKQARKGPVHIPDLHNKENIFMRWKEHFLVPDHRVRTINGASFEGFYYICFNQREGGISGIYFHSRSEKFQQLELKHVEDRGCFGAMEFR
ncbi:Glucose-induced degradation protein 4-like protein [Apiospora rasikravindrae]|uniref:Glucose-induced degradation protein 4-like protein n=1 Tax=Apiospora rasikravindrae TaxID=990691 RepID=A0ABR1SDG9_9PEZI